MGNGGEKRQERESVSSNACRKRHGGWTRSDKVNVVDAWGESYLRRVGFATPPRKTITGVTDVRMTDWARLSEAACGHVRTFSGILEQAAQLWG